MKIGIRIIGWIIKVVTYFVLLASGKARKLGEHPGTRGGT